MSEPCEYCGCDPCDCDWGMNSNEEEDAEKEEKQTYKITRYALYDDEEWEN